MKRRSEAQSDRTTGQPGRAERGCQRIMLFLFLDQNGVKSQQASKQTWALGRQTHKWQERLRFLATDALSLAATGVRRPSYAESNATEVRGSIAPASAARRHGLTWQVRHDLHLFAWHLHAFALWTAPTPLDDGWRDEPCASPRLAAEGRDGVRISYETALSL